MPRYVFGREKKKIIDESELKTAIMKFRITELHPERYAVEEDGRMVIHVSDGSGDETAAIALDECADFDYALPLLPFDAKDGDVERKEDAAVFSTKAEARILRDALEEKKRKLEEALEDCRAQISGLEQALEDKYAAFRLIRSYAGLDGLVKIRSGESAPEGAKLHVHQEKLFMDECIGVYEKLNGGYDSLDIDSLEKFDEWIAREYRTYMPEEKCVTAWQIRREPKDYGYCEGIEGAILQHALNVGNFGCYILIRNGGAVWRIASDARIPATVFPTRKETAEAMGRPDGSYKELVKAHLPFFFILQGIADHTNILGASFGKGGVDFIRPEAENPDLVLVRDSEAGYLTDGRPSWSGYLEACNRGIGKGSRIMLLMSTRDLWNERCAKDEWIRTGCYGKSLPAWPNLAAVHTVEEVDPEAAFSKRFKILFNPGDEIYGGADSHKRKRRLPFFCFGDEVVNFDEVRIEDVEYYLQNRIERRNYVRSMPQMFRLLKALRAEREVETPLARLICREAGLDPESREDLGKAFEAIRWWKLKTKFRRAVTSDNDKAFRMCLKRLSQVSECKPDDGAVGS